VSALDVPEAPPKLVPRIGFAYRWASRQTPTLLTYCRIGDRLWHRRFFTRLIDLDIWTVLFWRGLFAHPSRRSPNPVPLSAIVIL
jgi:hypothetical protein